MKKIFFIIVITIAFISCKNSVGNEDKYGSKIQGKFDNFLKLKINEEFYASNEIQKEEFFKKYNDDLISFIDSNKIFVGWNGKIEDIKTQENSNTTEITCKISFKTDENRTISFYSNYILENSKLKSDSLYNKIKKIADFSNVYFDGFITRDINNKVVYDDNETTELRTPNFKFNLLNISENSNRKYTLSKNLNKAVNANFEVSKLLKLKISKQITEKEWKEKMNNLSLDKIENSLNPEEKQYSNLIKQYLLNDIMNQ